MAPYAMCHLKLEMLLRETGYKPKDGNKQQRLRVFLTNSLEEAHPDTGTLFASWLSQEATEANYVKRDTPIMCVIGNPPYSVSSINKGNWIKSLTEDYKKDLNEKNIQPLSDDYIKFIRYGQYFIEKNESGILAYISNNSFIDGIVHRQMRKSLLNSFDNIFILDLHGSAKKIETAADGRKDENVFDIQQGVSVNILIKTGKKKENEFGKVFHYDLYGSREHKYNYLIQNTIKTINWVELDYCSPNYFFTKKNFKEIISYEKGFKFDEFFKVYNTGIETGRDNFFIDYEITKLKNKLETVFQYKEDSEVQSEFKITNTSSFRFKDNLLKSHFDEKKILKIIYRPFDYRYTYYDINLQRRASYNTIKHLIKDNLALSTCRQQSTFDFQHKGVSP